MAKPTNQQFSEKNYQQNGVPRGEIRLRRAREVAPPSVDASSDADKGTTTPMKAVERNTRPAKAMLRVSPEGGG
jgi:hypothetical protein